MRTNENKSADAPPLTRSVAQFAASTRYEDIPSDVIALSRKAVLDCLGLAFAGSVAEGTILLRRHIASLGCVGGSSTIFGSDMRTHARFAALANGTAMHSDDYDDTHNPSRIHPSASVAAALFAAADAGNYSGPDVLAAFNVGVEVSCKISIAEHEAGSHAVDADTDDGSRCGTDQAGADPPYLVPPSTLGIRFSPAPGSRRANHASVIRRSNLDLRRPGYEPPADQHVPVKHRLIRPRLTR